MIKQRCIQSKMALFWDLRGFCLSPAALEIKRKTELTRTFQNQVRSEYSEQENTRSKTASDEYDEYCTRPRQADTLLPTTRTVSRKIYAVQHRFQNSKKNTKFKIIFPVHLVSVQSLELTKEVKQQEFSKDHDSVTLNKHGIPSSNNFGSFENNFFTFAINLFPYGTNEL